MWLQSWNHYMTVITADLMGLNIHYPEYWLRLGGGKMIQPVGYFKIWRELFSKPIWLNSTPEQKTILITLIAMANFREKKWEWEGKPFKCQPGQFITSLASIAKECGKGVAIKNVRTALERFEKLGFLANQSTKTGRLITILNWEMYQGDDEQGGKASGKDRAKTGQRPGNQRAPKEEGKEGKEGNNTTSDAIAFQLTVQLKDGILRNYPKAKIPEDRGLQKWETTIDRMIRLDNRTPEEISTVIDFALSDSFWRQNILSADALRKQFDKLAAKMGGSQNTKQDHFKDIET
jgi:hypothetical protein